MLNRGGNGLAQILQEDHYYPFGLTYMGTLNYNYGTQENELLYQGKELQDEHNLQWHDFGARMYDAQLGRWHSPDPMLQYSSPYLAMGNSPTNGTDPSGMWFDRIKGHSSTGFALYQYMSYMRNKGYTWDGKLNQWYGLPSLIDGTGAQGGYDISDMIWGDSDAANTEARNWYEMKMVETTLRALIEKFYADLVETQEENREKWLEEHKNFMASLYDGYGMSFGGDGDPLSFWESLELAWDLDLIMPTFPDLISLDFTLTSSSVAGGTITYSLNIFTRGDAGINLTRTEQDTWGPNIEWGPNLNFGYFQGNGLECKPSTIYGAVTTWSAGYKVSLQVTQGYDNNGVLTWIIVGTGFGLSGGVSYGEGNTYTWP